MNNVQEFYEYHASTQGKHLPWEELSIESRTWWICAYNSRHREQYSKQGESILGQREDDFLLNKD